ncbi:Fe-S oxidoreductase [Leucobacter soli]|uniref:Fe-S oxidoreductase n=2 Tax=Leucobacter soli TaxID=2812850 RepID=A0A916NP86_9MICO|nr:Fe-S oxidoreductase [Leucobacter soli]CAG7618020.1 hypothetical protein LEUCIP111803_02164 [Leucobacter soli]
MQLGARWPARDAPHRSVPEALHPAIAELEAAHPDAGYWTLTWLEGRPVCRLDAGGTGLGRSMPGGWTLSLSAEGEVVRSTDPYEGEQPAETIEDDDDWLA